MRKRDAFYWMPPSGESLADVALRVDYIIGSLQHIDLRPSSAIIVTHFNVMQIFRTRIEGIMQSNFEKALIKVPEELKIKNGGVIHYTRRNPGTGEVEDQYKWRRIITPWKRPQKEPKWYYLEERYLTNEDILTSYETDYEFINSDLFQADVDVEISDIVHGNSFVYGQNVTVTGEIYGDLFVIANSLNIAEDAVVYGNIFALATNITISGLTSDIYAMVASSFTLNDSGYIDRNINLTADSVSLSGKIGRDVNLTCNNLSISESDEKIIGGDLSYTSSSEAQIPEEVIGGKITYTAPVEVDTTALLLSEIYNIISVLLYAFAFIIFRAWPYLMRSAERTNASSANMAFLAMK